MNLTSNPTEGYPTSTDDGIVKNFFFCFATGVDTRLQTLSCESYSGFFDVNVTSSNSLGHHKRADGDPQSPLTVPTAVLPVVSSTAFVVVSGLPTATPAPTLEASPATGSATAMATFHALTMTTSVPPTGTTTVQPSGTSSTAQTDPAVSKSSKAGLSTGAIIGIAIGGFFAILLALLVGFFCYRRNRRLKAERTPEQVLLTHHMHSGSRDLMAEKTGSGGPFFAPIAGTRPSSEPYDHLSASAPYNGPVGPGRLSPLPQGSLVPQRNPTSATFHTTHTDVSDMSRGLSNASGPISPRSTVRGEGDFEDPYHDVPIYRDARHIPQVYQGNPQAPLLSEPGMTDEELTRLEEEERRIDAAILEAEGRRL